uniref:Bifunctional inhibitor/plant lipid transfer protein/seed storage helical domain-containing protein n=1 Tax=Triticum urartu TaxID=4572 RepID=A0A8R7PZ35_TRIUA
MERSRRLLLVAGLLAALLPAAAAAFGPQPGAPCEPTLLAPQVALFCAPDFPTAQCCELGVPVVDLSASVPCVCRVPAEPQLVMAGLNATHIALYSSGLRPGGAHLAAACEAHPPPAAVVSSPLPTHPSPATRRRKDARPPQQQYCAASSPDTTCGVVRPGAHLSTASATIPGTPSHHG